jgi:hypothetical protein
VKPKAPPEMLQEMFEIQESLQDARAGALDAARRAELAGQRGRLRARYEAEEARIRGPLSEAWDAGAAGARPAVLAAFKESLATRAYLRTVIEDLDAVLGESQEAHVSHRRH